MKKYNLSIFALFISLSLFAQNSDDVLRYSTNRISGTARSASLSNAIGALGGDYTSIGINPAGIAVYRSSEFTFTPFFNIFNSASEYYNNQNNASTFSLPIGQIGYVATYQPMYSAADDVVNTNFSIGYTRNNNYKKRHFITGNNVRSSLLDEFVYHAGNVNPEYLDSRIRNAFDAALIDPLDDNAFENSSIRSEYYHAFEDFDKNGNIIWGPDNGLFQSRTVDESGYAGDFEIAGGLNYKNKLYLGGMITVPTFNFRQNIQHYEQVEPSDNEWTYLNNYTFEEKLRTSGVGFNAKAGLIYRPINSIRIGAAFHTPTFYAIDEMYSYSTTLPKGFQDKTKYNSDINEFSYYLLTPYKAIGSFAFLFGSRGFISFDYEFTDCSISKFEPIEVDIYSSNIFAGTNRDIKNTLSQTHNIRVGAEYRPTELFTLRAGYGMFQSPYKSEFLNYDDLHQTFSGGFGIKMNNMFVDVAYLLRQEKNYYSPYYSDLVNVQDQKLATIKSNSHNILMTLGWRF